MHGIDLGCALSRSSKKSHTKPDTSVCDRNGANHGKSQNTLNGSFSGFDVCPQFLVYVLNSELNNRLVHFFLRQAAQWLPQLLTASGVSSVLPKNHWAAQMHKKG